MPLTADQHARRRQGIGASDVGAILGLAEYKTPLDVYMEKLGLTPPSEDSEAAEWGHLLEEPIAQKYARSHPGTMLDTSDTVTHPEYAWALATPDRIAYVGAARWLVEIKTREDRTAGEFGEPGTDQVPDEVLVQCQWQMFVTGLERCDVALLVNGRRFSVYPIRADQELQQNLQEQVESFWRNHVLAQVPPDVTAQDNPTLAKLFPKDTAPMLEGDAETFALVKDIADLKSEAKALEKNIDEREAQLKAKIGTAKGFTFPNGSKATWAANKDSEVVNYKGIVEALNPPAEMIAANTTTKPGARVLRITVKEG